MAPPAPPRSRSTPWGIIAIALFVLAGGGWVLWDMKPWVKDAPAAPPVSSVKILGRDDAAARKAEAELEGSASTRPKRPAPSGGAAPSGSAP